MNTHKEPNWCKTSQQWVEELYPAGNPVVDPDGWDRKDFEYSWYQEPISKDEFEKRLMNSTLRMPPVLVEPTPPSQIEEELREFMFDLIDKHFPKNDCRERGQAMVMVAEILTHIETINNTK